MNDSRRTQELTQPLEWEDNPKLIQHTKYKAEQSVKCQARDMFSRSVEVKQKISQNQVMRGEDGKEGKRKWCANRDLST